MGYDNECIVNMQSLPGEYFCPVCRTLINPDEALQAPCTHLFCKPCLAYVVATTHACAYDGYLVTEADSKSLGESNKELAETIGKIAVYCLYHRSNCQWQGTLAESTAHCAGCTFGNSPVMCNRCGTQIIHRQVQEHAQICPGVQPLVQAAENAQAQAAAVANQAASQDPSSGISAGSAAAATAATAAPSVTATTTAPSAPAYAPAAATAVTGQAQVQGGAAVYPQAAQAPTPEQWYQQQQQYQQYYQQYPGYDPYQQQYYAQYQQQAYPQYMQAQMQPMAPQPYMQQPQPQPQPGQPHAQGQLQAQPQPQPQPQSQPQGLAAQPQLQQLPQLQPHPQTQPQLQPQPHVPAQVTQMPGQQPLATTQQPHPHAPHSQPPPHGNAAGQPYPQPQHATQARPPQLQAPLQYQQPVLLQQNPQQMPHPHAHPQYQPRAQHAPQSHPLPHPQGPQQPPMQMQPQPQPHPHPQAIPQMQHPQPPGHPVPGYQSYPQPSAPQQHPMHMNPLQQGMPPQHPQSQSHFTPHQPPQMHPPHSQMTMPIQQQPAMPPTQGPANLYPIQQQVQHPVHQPGPPVYQQPGMQPHTQHSFAQPQAQGPLHPGLASQQGPAPLHPGLPSQQGPAPLQQSLRPQGPAYMQQSTPVHPHVQMNAPLAQGMPPHQAQARPMMVSQGMPQQPVPQSPVAGSKLMQPGMIQQSPNQNYMGKANPREPTLSELQSGPIQQSQLLHARSQGASSATPKQGASTPDKIGKVPPLEDGLAVKNAEGSKAGENISEHVFDSKSKGDEGKGAIDAKGKDVLAEENRDASETLAKEENVDGQLVKQVNAEEANASDEVNEGSHGLKVAQGENDIKGQEGKFDDKPSSLFKGEHTRSIPELHTQQGPDKSVQREPLQPNPERTNQGYFSDGQISGNVNLMHPQQMQTQGALDRGQLQRQSAHQNVFPSQGHGYPQPGYSDRNPSQFPQQYPGSDEHQGMPPGGLQQIPYGHPHHMPDPTMTSQRPPAHDRMFPQPITQSSQERRFPEPSSHQMHAHGHAMPPCQMRPPGHNVHESFPYQGKLPVAQEPFWPPPHTGIPGPGLPPPPGGVPSRHGLPPKGFDQQAMAPPGQTQSHPPPPHVGGARTALGEPLARPIMRGLSPGTLDTPNKMMGGPPFIPEDRVGKSANVKAMEAEAHAIKRHGVFDGSQLESHRPLPTEHAPYGQPNVMKMNGMTNHVPVGGMHESNFGHGLPEDRFRPLPEERFKPFPEEGFRTAHDERFRASALGPGRPAHLDGEGLSRFDGYLSSSRPLEKVTQQPGGANALISRPPSSYQPGAPLPPSSGGSQVHLEMGDRDRPLPLHDHPGRRHDGSFVHTDRLNLVSDFGRHGTDGLPPVRSPGNFSRDIPDGLPSQLRRGLDGLGSLPHSLSSNIRDGEMVIPQNMSGFLRGGNFGGFRSHLDSGETGGPGNLHSHVRIGDPGFNGRFSSVSLDGDIHSFEQSRKRKAGSMSRCLICKIDCDTIEALDLHSQTREHQKMAMNMVLNIKKENAKKHRTSENATPFEDANKSRKPNFGKRSNA